MLIIKSIFLLNHQFSKPRDLGDGTGWTIAHPGFADQLTLSQPGEQIMPTLLSTCPPPSGFSDLQIQKVKILSYPECSRGLYSQNSENSKKSGRKLYWQVFDYFFDQPSTIFCNTPTSLISVQHILFLLRKFMSY